MIIRKASFNEFPGLESRKMIKSSPQILGRTELDECSKAIAVMVHRVRPDRFEKQYNAFEIATYLGQLPQGQLSAYYVKIDTLKKALSNELIRHCLSALLPSKFGFIRSSTRYEIILCGNSSFRHGYQIKFNESVEETNDLRREINSLRKSLVELYLERENRSSVAIIMPQAEPRKVLNTPIYASPPTTVSYTQSDSITTNKKRGRPVLTKEGSDKRVVSLQNQVHCSKKSKLSFEDDGNSDVNEVVGRKLLALIQDAGNYSEKINGEECVSIVSGILIQDLISYCGCSVEKILWPRRNLG